MTQELFREILGWIWGGSIVISLVLMFLMESVNSHMKNDDNHLWIFIAVVCICSPVILVAAPILFLVWIMHRFIGFILKRLHKI